MDNAKLRSPMSGKVQELQQPVELVGIVLDYTTPRAYWDTPSDRGHPACLYEP